MTSSEPISHRIARFKQVATVNTYIYTRRETRARTHTGPETRVRLRLSLVAPYRNVLTIFRCKSAASRVAASIVSFPVIIILERDALASLAKDHHFRIGD